MLLWGHYTWGGIVKLLLCFTEDEKVQVFDKQFPEKQVPTIHSAYFPSQNIKPGHPITFLVRTFGSQTGKEVWDFGDGREKVTVNSGVVKRESQNSGKYAEAHFLNPASIYEGGKNK